MAHVSDTVISPTARRYIERMLRFLAPAAGKLDAQFRAALRARYATGGSLRDGKLPRETRRDRDARSRALLAITPGAAARARTLARFFEQVEYNGRRLAKLNAAPEEVSAALDDFGALLEPVLAGAFQPAREQLRLATIFSLNRAYYDVREAEAQTLFKLSRAETDSETLDESLRGFVRVLTRAVRARAGRLIVRKKGGAARLGRPMYVERGDAAERYISGELKRKGYGSFWSYPVGDSAAVQFAFASKYPWLPREISLVGAAASRCAEAIRRAQLEGAVRRLQAEARRAEESERRRVGRELHDEAGQSLLSLRLQLELLERDAPEYMSAPLRQARQTAERTVGELRRAIAALSPEALERLGLRTALRRLAERFRRTHACTLSVHAPPACANIAGPQAEVVYRVAQECFQNIAKHSGADQVRLSLRKAAGQIRMTVADNGAGFSADQIRMKSMAFGLVGMGERAALLGGAVAVRSAPGKGTRVALVLPQLAATVGHYVANQNLVG